MTRINVNFRLGDWDERFELSLSPAKPARLGAMVRQHRPSTRAVIGGYFASMTRGNVAKEMAVIQMDIQAA